MNKKGLGFIGIVLMILGVIALYFIYKEGFIGAFITFIRGWF